MAVAALLLLAVSAAAAPANVSEFPLGVHDLHPRGISSSADGQIWFTLTTGKLGVPDNEQEPTGEVDRISASGQVTRFPVSQRSPEQIASLGDRGQWFLAQGELWRLAPDGTAARVPGVDRDYLGGAVVAGAGGSVWVGIGRGSAGPDVIFRIEPTGELKEFPLPGGELRPVGLAVGVDGNLWIAEGDAHTIGRLTPAGQYSSFPLPLGSEGPAGIAAGPDGNLWFTVGRGGIGRITPAGEITVFPIPREKFPWAGSIVPGGDGRLWFTAGQGRLGRITPDGRISSVALPNAESEPVALTAAPDGSIWYAANGEGPCVGGGGTCMIHAPRHQGIIARVTDAPLAVSPRGGRIPVSGGRAQLSLACEGGDADGVCRGVVRIRSLNGALLGKRRYGLRTDVEQPLSVPLNREGMRLLSRWHRLAVKLRLRGSSGGTSSRTASLRGG